MKRIQVLTMCFALLSAILPLKTQGVITVTFDPPSLPGGGKLLQTYTESGVVFTSLFDMSFASTDSGLSGRPDDGTAHFDVLRNFTSFTLSTGPFQLDSVDLAEYSVVFASPQTIGFTGHRVGGGTVSTNFVTDGIIDGTGPLIDFQTFHFGNAFTQLTSVDMSATFAMDNLRLEPIPEPSDVSLLVAGIIAISWCRIRQTNGQRQLGHALH